MRGAERVIIAFAALGEAGKPAALAQRADARAPAGEDLVRVGLGADIPDQAVGRGVEHVVQRHGELDDTEAGTEMSAGGGDRVDGLGAQLVGELAQLRALEAPQVGGRLDAIKKRSAGALNGRSAWGLAGQECRGGLRQRKPPRGPTAPTTAPYRGRPSM